MATGTAAILPPLPPPPHTPHCTVPHHAPTAARASPGLHPMKQRARCRRSSAVSTLAASSAAADALAVVDLATAALVPAACVRARSYCHLATILPQCLALAAPTTATAATDASCAIVPAPALAAAALAVAALVAPLPSPPPAFPHTSPPAVAVTHAHATPATSLWRSHMPAKLPGSHPPAFPDPPTCLWQSGALPLRALPPLSCMLWRVI